MIPDASPLPPLLLVASALLAGFSGLPALLPFLTTLFTQRLAAAAMVLSGITGLCCSVSMLLSRQTVAWRLHWPFPFGPAEIGIDPLTAFFALPILIVASCCSLYGLGYWPADENRRTTRKLTVFFGVLVSSMLFVTMARSAGVFLLAWEIMALAAFFVLTTDDHSVEVRNAGTLYMICTHIGTLLLFALFSLMKMNSGSFLFPAAGSMNAAAPLATTLFVTALLGFAFKAGVMPFHIWLPSAHANAPSHVSAIMSGVILKIGIYGILRTLTFFTAIPIWWGMLLLVLGIVSGIVGVLFAVGQHDLKRLLAYHSIENIGIIVMGIGVATLGSAVNSPTLMTLGVAGALLHVLNHAVFKALLFLGAGSIIHAAGTREIDRMGGLLRHLPWTGATFLVGSVAICGLPPLNGFVSEFLIYLGFFRGTIEYGAPLAIGTALGAPALALIGGLAVACFVKVFGTVFLGAPRTPLVSRHEAPLTMRIPMGALSLLCLLIGAGSLLFAPLLESVLAVCLPSTASAPLLSDLAPLKAVSLLSLLLIGLAAALFILYRERLKKFPSGSGATWGCGYLAPTVRMQYTASSFAEMLVNFFSGILRTVTHLPLIKGMFPRTKSFSSHVPEAVLELIYIPVLERLYERALPIRRLQSGVLQQYVLYILITIVLIFLLSYL